MRIFIGLPLPVPMGRALAATAADLKVRFRGLSATRPEGMHITLFFWGEADLTLVSRIKAFVFSFGSAPRPVEAHFGGVETFPPTGNPRVIWAGLDRGSEHIVRIQADMKKALEEAGVKLEDEGRPFRPHITLARNKFARLEASALADISLPANSFVFDRVVLFQSILKPAGAEYTALAERAFA